MHYSGVILRGAGRGRELGFPTANILLPDSGISGIFAGQVTRKGTRHPAAIFADPKRMIMEAHLLDFDGNLYGETITVNLFSKIRDSQHFTDDAALRAAIADDIAKARKYFESHEKSAL